jgi:hypothetical protein
MEGSDAANDNSPPPEPPADNSGSQAVATAETPPPAIGDTGATDDAVSGQAATDQAADAQASASGTAGGEGTGPLDAANDDMASAKVANDNAAKSTKVAESEPPAGVQGQPPDATAAGQSARDQAADAQLAGGVGTMGEGIRVSDAGNDSKTSVANDNAAQSIDVTRSKPPGGVVADTSAAGDVISSVNLGSDFVPPRAANDDVSGMNPDQDQGTPVIGRSWDTAVAKEWEGHAVIDLRANPNANEVWDEAYQRGDLRPDGNKVTAPGWSPENNRQWVQSSIIDQHAVVYLGTEPTEKNLQNEDLNQPAVFADEINQLEAAGYHRVGDYLVPPEL